MLTNGRNNYINNLPKSSKIISLSRKHCTSGNNKVMKSKIIQDVITLLKTLCKEKNKIMNLAKTNK